MRCTSGYFTRLCIAFLLNRLLLHVAGQIDNQDRSVGSRAVSSSIASPRSLKEKTPRKGPDVVRRFLLLIDEDEIKRNHIRAK